MPGQHNDLPIKELIEEADRQLKSDPNVTIYFKFTCDYCGARQTFDTPNTMYAEGQCEECGCITKIEKAGFALMFNFGKQQQKGP